MHVYSLYNVVYWVCMVNCGACDGNCIGVISGSVLMYCVGWNVLVLYVYRWHRLYSVD